MGPILNATYQWNLKVGFPQFRWLFLNVFPLPNMYILVFSVQISCTYVAYFWSKNEQDGNCGAELSP